MVHVNFIDFLINSRTNFLCRVVHKNFNMRLLGSYQRTIMVLNCSFYPKPCRRPAVVQGIEIISLLFLFLFLLLFFVLLTHILIPIIPILDLY